MRGATRVIQVCSVVKSAIWQPSLAGRSDAIGNP